jgi:hypothetical protein
MSSISVQLEDSIADFNNHRIEGFARHGGKQFSVPLFSHIEGPIWMGGCPVAGTDFHHQFDYIINLYGMKYEPAQKQVVIYRPFLDSYDSPNVDFKSLVKLICSLPNSAKVLIHCQAGLNRSGLVTALVMMQASNMSGQEAINLLREKRCAEVLCNGAFESFVLGHKRF